VSVLCVRLDFDDALQVNDVGAMDAEKTRGIERGFKAGDSLLLQVLFAFGCKGDVIVLRFHVVEFCDRNDENAGAIAKADALRQPGLREASRCGAICRRGVPWRD